jgi:hypothetical protein
MLQAMISQPVCLGIKPHLVYNCCWPLPTQSFSGPSPMGLMTIFYYLKFETPPTWRARSSYLYPPGTGWPSYIHRHWVPFSSPPMTRRAAVEVFEPSTTQAWIIESQIQSYFMTGSLAPVSSSWHQAPWNSRPAIYLFNWTLAVIVLM